MTLEFKLIQSENMNLLLTQQQKSKLRESLNKMIQTQTDTKFESLKTDLKSSQNQQFAEMKKEQMLKIKIYKNSFKLL